MRDLIKLYNIHSPSGNESQMLNALTDALAHIGLDVYYDSSYNLYGSYGKADSYPCIVAHMDEVHTKRPKDFRVVQSNGLLFGISQTSHGLCGIGADDKNGVWVALKIAKLFVRLHKPIKVAFFVQEETGCVGSTNSEISFFTDCRFILECDRRGSSDFISSIGGVQLYSKEFGEAVAPILKDFGYKPTDGLSTDVCVLVERGVGISTCNISCGYYNPHTNQEMTDIAQLRNCLSMVNAIMRLEDTYKHKYKPPKPIRSGYWTWYGNGYYKPGHFDDYGYYDNYGYCEGYYDKNGKFHSTCETENKKETKSVK